MSLQLEEYTSCQANQANETFSIANAGSAPATLSDIAIKFWIYDTSFASNSAASVIGTVNYDGCYGTSCTAVSGVSVAANEFSPSCGPSTQEANWEVVVSDSDAGVVLNQGVTWTNLQTAIHLGTSYYNFSPGSSAWYSPCGVGGGATYSNNLQYAIYYQGNLVTASGGVPPSCRPLSTCTPTPTGGVQGESLRVGEETPTTTPTPVTDEVAQTVLVEPNMTDGKQPIQFKVNLEQSGNVRLSIYAISGEEVYKTQVQGNQGTNTLVWQSQNQDQEKVASGLYIYVLQINDGASRQIETGQMVVIK